MSKYSSDSNSRDRTRSYSRYYNQRHRSSSSSSTDSSKYSRKKHSSRSESRYHKKSKRRHRSNSSSDHSSSRHKRSSRSYRRDESRSKRKYRRKSSSTSYESNNSNSSFKNHQSKSSKTLNDNEKNKKLQDDLLVGKSETIIKNDHDANWLQKNVLDIVKRENSIEQINQEGFVFKVFNPSSEHKEEETTDKTKFNVPKINEEVTSTLPTEESTFIICNPERLLNARYKLLTKQERCLNWAKKLFESYNQSERNGGQF
uniref:Serine/Arginine-related protein 53 n=1 Tax=Schizaphis graminum TaxID=13262 RepID=A0A2S2N753_SCHGA